MLEGQPIDAANVLHIQLHTFLHLHIHGTRNMTLFLASRIYTAYIYIYIHIHVWLWLKLIDCNTRNTVHNPFCNPFRTHFFLPYIYIYIYTLVLCLYVDAWMLFSYWRILFLDQVGNWADIAIAAEFLGPFPLQQLHPLTVLKGLVSGCWWLKSGDHQLRLVVYHIIYKVYTFQVVQDCFHQQSGPH